MARVTRFGALALLDAFLNETRLFWDSTKPSSGLPTNALFIDTTTGKLYQNTGTVDTPIWTERVGGLNQTAEQNSGLITGDNISGLDNKRFYAPSRTLPTTEPFYIITGMDIQFTSSGNFVCGVDIINTDPPTDVGTYTVAATASLAHMDEELVAALIPFYIVRGGAKVSPWVNLDHTGNMTGNTKSSEDSYKVETFPTTGFAAPFTTSAWVASTDEPALEIRYKGYGDVKA